MYGGPADAFLLAGQSAFEAWARALLFAAWAIVLPGATLARFVERREAGFVLPLGVLWCVAAGWAAHVSGPAWLFPVVSVVVAIGGLRSFIRDEWRFDRSTIAPSVVLVGVLLALRSTGVSDGGFQFETPGMEDNAFHAGVAFELARGGTPEVPGLAGVPLRYHYGQDLIRAAAFVWGGLHPWQSLVRFEPVLGGLCLVGIAGIVVRSLGGSERAVALAPWTVFLSDASWMAAFGGTDAFWVDGTRMNFVLAILLGNAGSPLALSVVLCLLVLLEKDGGRVAVVGALGGIVVALLKSFAGAQFVVATVAMGLTRRSRAAVATSAVCAGALLSISYGATDGTAIAFVPFGVAEGFARRWGLPDAAIGIVLWLVVGTGARWVALGPLVDAVRRRSVVAIGLGAFCFAGLIVGSLFDIRLRSTLHSESVFNDAAYFLEQGAWPLWLFVAVWIGGASRVPARLLVVLALAVPSTLQAAWRFATSPRVVASADALAVLEPLAGAERRNAVVLQARRSEVPPLPIVLLGLRVPISNFFGYLPRYLDVASIERREEAARVAFNSLDAAETRSALSMLGASHLLVVDGHAPRTAGDALTPLAARGAARLFAVRLD